MPLKTALKQVLFGGRHESQTSFLLIGIAIGQSLPQNRKAYEVCIERGEHVNTEPERHPFGGHYETLLT